MAVRPLFDRGGGDTRRRNIALDCLVFAVENLCAIAGDDDPVTFVEIGDLLRQRRQREGIGTKIGFPLAIADDERRPRSEEHTSELQSLMRISYAVFCLKKKTTKKKIKKKKSTKQK